MKTSLFRNIRNAVLTLLLLCGISSCNYLDIVPVEQADLSDANQNNETTLGFLFSCYAGIRNPMSYTAFEQGCDEYVLPPLWGHGGQYIQWNNNTPGGIYDGWSWGNNNYRFIGQCYLFQRELHNAVESTEQEKAMYLAETNFLIAYYHMQTLIAYGPCAITSEYIDQTAPESAYPGRSHFDYVVDWICSKFDEAIESGSLPATRSGDEWGRATTVMAKALKARLRVYAASPLWNGSFPYPEWVNKNYETPGYGKELVSHTYDAQKWEVARQACEEAYNAAIAAGHKLFSLEDARAKISQDGLSENLPYVPLRDENNPETGVEDKEFKERVLLMRYVTATRLNEGNMEIIWGIANQGDVLIASLPHCIHPNNSNGWHSGYSGVSPTLNSIKWFYTENGKPVDQDPAFYPEDQWFQSAGASGRIYGHASSTASRSDIIKLNARREPRFYAWIAFDGGDFGTKLYNGNPLTLNLRNGQMRGYNAELFNRDNCQTGYLSQKYLAPASYYSNSGSTMENKPRPLIRMAELYLNLAECYANQGNAAKTLEFLNPIRERAGIPALTQEELGNQAQMVKWVQNERSVELFNEGQRYYDVRRWMLAPQTMGAGVRKGLNATVVDPDFTTFNTETTIDQNFAWHNRLYLLPLFANEVYKNPQFVQAPGY